MLIAEYLTKASSNIAKITTLLKDSNNFAAVELALKLCPDYFDKFNLISEKIKDDINKEMQFFRNNEIRRFGDNPHRLQLSSGATPAPATSLIDVEEIKHAPSR
jgi:hypothetical protein